MLGRVKGLEIFGSDYDTPDGTCFRDEIHVSDLIDAHLLSLDHFAKSGDSLVLNCGYTQGFSVHQVVRAAERAAGESLGATLRSGVRATRLS